MSGYGLCVCVLTYSLNKHLLSIYTVPGAGCRQVGQREPPPIIELWGDTTHLTHDQVW